HSWRWCPDNRYSLTTAERGHHDDNPPGQAPGRGVVIVGTVFCICERCRRFRIIRASTTGTYSAISDRDSALAGLAGSSRLTRPSPSTSRGSSRLRVESPNLREPLGPQGTLRRDLLPSVAAVLVVVVVLLVLLEVVARAQGVTTVRPQLGGSRRFCPRLRFRPGGASLW
uniref:Uncharacterized protein n=1 Tax=Anopheles melas TaxID=34690 RepID=A0A182TNM4_9DIPT